MIKFTKPSSIILRNFATRTVLVLITVAAIVWFLPRTEGKIFHFEEGKVWIYPDLASDFDFPVMKSEAALNAERDTVKRQFQPYFNRSEKVAERQINTLKEQYPNGLPDVPAGITQRVIAKLQELYSIGVVDPQHYSKLDINGNSRIRIVTEKAATVTPKDSVLTTIGAYEHLFMDEQLGPLRSALQKCNLNEFIEPNLIYDKDRNETELNDLLSLIPQASGMIMANQTFVHRGEVLTESQVNTIQAYEKALQAQNASEKAIKSTIYGQVLFVLILVILYTLYLTLFRKDYFEKPRSLTMLYVMIVVYPILTSIFMQHNFFSVYLIPYAMAPIFIRVFMDSRTAFITHILLVLISAVVVKFQFEFIIIQLVAGLAAIYSLRELSNRSQIFLTSIIVVIASALIYFSIQLIQTTDAEKLDTSMYYHFLVNGFFLLFAYPLMLIIEKAFGFISAVTLFELSNTNSQLLRRLSEVAPGTFQHSIMVGNLAAEIANKVGAKSLLTRTGALYHDIGKIENPAFFTENQKNVNPHDALTEQKSAEMIVGHVTEGLKLAERANVPRIIRDFIATHHGEGMAKYFYVKYKNAHPDEDFDESPFHYPGPNPFTKEQAILMMCDAVEAASRSLKEYNEESIDNLVNKIIDGQVADGFFHECPITFRDITVAKQVLTNRLKAIYHTRIQYPEEKKKS